ncbi:MAG TPA: hypothetical protein DGG94_19365 [Micromonosporaceae bacterium]|nr:hypothetical protein [Micromonosporaceae bacterium]HCU51928.1 hypothetical protein [Micromonosporaceae bacterium]
MQQCAELRARTDEMTTQLEALRAQHIHEQKDVERLEGLSLTRILATLRGARDDALARERAEADAVSYRVAEAEARLEVMRREHDVSQIRLSQLSAAPVIYTAALQEKERHLTALGGALGERLLELAEERGRLTGDLREVAEALRAASSAQEALSAVGNTLDSASNWSTYDTFFGGGVISSAVKHSRLDEAAQAAAHADQQLSVLRTELADVDGEGLKASRPAVDGLTRFVDVWFDNIFTDLAVGDQIKQAQQNIDRSTQMVTEVQRRLELRATQGQARLAAIEIERRNIAT